MSAPEVRYAEALEQQVALQRYVSSPAYRRQADRRDAELTQAARAARVTPGPLGIRETAVGSLLRGETFFWAPELCRVLEETAPAMPDWVLTEEALPAPNGFLWFARPLALPEDAASPLCALSWLTVDLFREGQVPAAGVRAPWDDRLLALPPDVRSAERVLHVVFYVRRPERLQGLPVTLLPWPLGRGFAGAPEPVAGRPVTILAPRGGTEERRLAKLRYAAAAFAFLHQQLLVAPAVRVEDRGARRRLAREGCPPERQVVRVVRLRRPVRSASPGAEPSDVAWSCRWIVRGHWRRQWWPSLGRHQPRWIAPHVKGPEDKPLSPPRATVFAVVR